MSRAIQIRVSESVVRTVHVEDGVESPLEMLPILAPDRMGELLAKELEEQGFIRDGNKATRTDPDGVEITVDLDTATVSVKIGAAASLEESIDRRQNVGIESKDSDEARLRDFRRMELARELVGMNILDERTTEHAQRKSRSANPAWSFYAEWGPPGGYELGSMSIHGMSSCCHHTGHRTAPQVRIGHVINGRALPVVDLSPQFAHVVSRCSLGDGHVSALLELTDAEIVAVSVVAPPAVTRCVEDAIWETAVTPPDPHLFQTSSRIVLVH